MNNEPMTGNKTYHDRDIDFTNYGNKDKPKDFKKRGSIIEPPVESNINSSS